MYLNTYTLFITFGITEVACRAQYYINPESEFSNINPYGANYYPQVVHPPTNYQFDHPGSSLQPGYINRQPQGFGGLSGGRPPNIPQVQTNQNGIFLTYAMLDQLLMRPLLVIDSQVFAMYQLFKCFEKHAELGKCIKLIEKIDELFKHKLGRDDLAKPTKRRRPVKTRRKKIKKTKKNKAKSEDSDSKENDDKSDESDKDNDDEDEDEDEDKNKKKKDDDEEYDDDYQDK